jgi:hypothetical protein
MNSLEALVSRTETARSLRAPDLATKEDEVLGVGHYDPKTEEPFSHNAIWYCQRESQNVSLGHLDKEQEFWKER